MHQEHGSDPQPFGYLISPALPKREGKASLDSYGHLCRNLLAEMISQQRPNDHIYAPVLVDLWLGGHEVHKPSQESMFFPQKGMLKMAVMTAH